MRRNHLVNLDIDGRITTWTLKQMGSESINSMKLAQDKIIYCDLH